MDETVHIRAYAYSDLCGSSRCLLKGKKLYYYTLFVLCISNINFFKVTNKSHDGTASTCVSS
jgi:hypothetical protein